MDVWDRLQRTLHPMCVGAVSRRLEPSLPLLVPRSPLQSLCRPCPPLNWAGKFMISILMCEKGSGPPRAPARRQQQLWKHSSAQCLTVLGPLSGPEASLLASQTHHPTLGLEALPLGFL